MRAIGRHPTLLSAARGTAAALAALALAACAGGDTARDRPSAEYDRDTGRLQRLVFDSDDDGRNDAVGVMDGARVTRIELDTSGNGVTDRWEFFDDAGRLIKVGLARQDDGVMDAVALYGPGDELRQLEISTGRDGRFDRVEFYAGGVLARAEEDSDGDGRVDTWETYRPNPRSGPGEPPALVSMVAFDDTGSGRPTRRLIYEPGGGARVEIDDTGNRPPRPASEPQ